MLFLCLIVQVDGQKITGYAPYYRTFPASFDFSLYTHIHFFAVWPDSSGALLWPGQHDSTSLSNKYQLIQSRMEEDQKLLITFGGTSSAGSLYFSQMAGDSTSFERFAQNAVSLCQAWGAHGIDIDWEWGKKLGDGDTELKSGYLKLMSRLRQLCNGNGLLLSTAVSASSWFGDNYPAEGVDQANYICVMSYTYNGAWSSTANHHSPLSKTESIGLSYWKNRGIAAEKLKPGVPFYGYKYDGTSQPGESFSSVSTLNYTEVKNHLSLGYEIHVDTINGSYCSNASSIIFFDSPDDLAAKVQHVKEMGYDGIFIWEIGQDDPDQTLSRSIYNSVNELDPVSVAEKNQDENYRVVISPTSGILLSSSSGDRLSARLYSLEGKQLAFSDHNYREAVISTLDLPPGIYIVLISDGKEVIAQKISL